MISKKLSQPHRVWRFVRAFNRLLIIVLLFMGMFGKRGLMDLRRMNSENQRISEEYQKLKEQNEELAFQIEALQKDKQVQEHTIRKVLGYIKPDETIIEF